MYAIQPTGPPANERLVELLLLLDACRRAGAGRADHRGRAGLRLRATGPPRPRGEAVGARVVADVLVTAGAQRLVVVGDPHAAAHNA